MPTRPPPLLYARARRVLGGVWVAGLLAGPALAQTPAVTVQVQVQPGDTASMLALPWVPEGATLEQTLVALLRANPEAFIDDNLNLLRAGQTLRLPERAQVLQQSAEQARETVLDHHSRFRDYAQRLAEQARTVREGPARELAGTVSAAGGVRPSPGTGQDRLTLTKELQDAKALQVVVEKQTQEALVHLAALQKNIEALQKLAQASEAAATSAPSPAAIPAGTPTPAVWPWLAGLLGIAAAAGALLVGVRRRRDAASAASAPGAAVPPQIAGLSLELGGPTPMDRRP